MYKLLIILCIFSFSITIKAIDFNLFPALFDINNTLLSKQCRKQLVSGEILCTKSNIEKWTENGIIPGIKKAEDDGLIYLQEHNYDQYHCCGAWDLSDCIKRFVKLKCSKIDYQIMIEIIKELHDQLSQNMCSDFMQGSSNCKPTKKPIFEVDLTKSFLKIPDLYPECQRLIEIRQKPCSKKAHEKWSDSSLYLELLEIAAQDDPYTDEFMETFYHVHCCILWESLDCMVNVVEGECDIDQDLIDVTVIQIEANYSQPELIPDCSDYPHHSNQCQRTKFNLFEENTKKATS